MSKCKQHSSRMPCYFCWSKLDPNDDDEAVTMAMEAWQARDSLAKQELAEKDKVIMGLWNDNDKKDAEIEKMKGDIFQMEHGKYGIRDYSGQCVFKDIEIRDLKVKLQKAVILIEEIKKTLNHYKYYARDKVCEADKALESYEAWKKGQSI